MQTPHHMHRYTRAQIGHGARGIRCVRQGPLVCALAQEVDLQLRHPLWMRLVSQPDGYRRGIAGPEIVARLVLLFLDRTLELSVREGIEVLADGTVVVGAQDDVGAARARLQAGVQGSSHVGAGAEVHRGTVVTRGEFHTELEAQVVGRQQPLVAADDPDVAGIGNARAADLIRGGFSGCVRRGLLAVGRVTAHHVRHKKADVPIGIGTVAHPHGEIAVDRLFLNFAPAERRIGRIVDDLGRGRCSGTAAQSVLVDVVVLEVEPQAGKGRVTRRRIGTERAAAGGTCPTRNGSGSQEGARQRELTYPM